jgi:hypothetical protein
MADGYASGKEPTATQRARYSNHRNDAELDLLLIGMA